MSTTGPDFSTSRAAEFATSIGKPTSRSFLEKARARGADDSGDNGPDFWRDARGQCWYPQEAVERWVEAWKGRRHFRQPGKVPGHLRAA